MLKVGDLVQYHGSEWGLGPKPSEILYCYDGDIAEVVERHEAVPAIAGWIIDYDDETGEPIYDEGIRAYVLVRLPNGLKAAIDGTDLERGRWKLLP